MKSLSNILNSSSPLWGRLGGGLLVALAFAFVSCDKDIDSNPTLQTPESFKLNTPAYSTQEIDLERSSDLAFSWSQPEYGFPVQAEYALQFSLDGNFTTSVDEALADETGETVADYWMSSQVYNVPKGTVAAKDLAKGLVQIAKWTEGNVPALLPVKVRAASTIGGQTIYSNIVDINVIPYYIELKDALPQLLYFVGPGGAGNWDNSADNFIPMSLVKDAKYDTKTGEGEFTYTGYFAADQFKLVLNPGNWAPMYGVNDGAVFFRATEGDADPGCWQPEEDGYYTFTFSTVGGPSNAVASLTKYDGALKDFDGWELIGSFNGWGDDGTVVLTPNAHNPHIWYGDATFTEDAEAKFRILGGWSDECGGDDFPYGLKTGNNIKIPAGSYKIVYNDIDRCYFFFEK